MGYKCYITLVYFHIVANQVIPWQWSHKFSILLFIVYRILVNPMASQITRPVDFPYKRPVLWKVSPRHHGFLAHETSILVYMAVISEKNTPSVNFESIR